VIQVWDQDNPAKIKVKKKTQISRLNNLMSNNENKKDIIKEKILCQPK
jgi:hypothetical protein